MKLAELLNEETSIIPPKVLGIYVARFFADLAKNYFEACKAHGELDGYLAELLLDGEDPELQVHVSFALRGKPPTFSMKAKQLLKQSKLPIKELIYSADRADEFTTTVGFRIIKQTAGYTTDADLDAFGDSASTEYNKLLDGVPFSFEVTL